MNFKYKKATQIINFFLTKTEQEKKGKTLYKTHLLKLLYLVDRIHIRKYGTFVTSAEYQAWTHGPVSPTIKNLIENIADKENQSVDVQYAETFIDANRESYTQSEINLETKKEVDWKVIAKTEKEVMEEAWERYKDKDVKEIIALLHTFPEWKDIYKGEKVSILTEKILEGEQEGFPKVSETIKEYAREQEVLKVALTY